METGKRSLTRRPRRRPTAPPQRRGAPARSTRPRRPGASTAGPGRRATASATRMVPSAWPTSTPIDRRKPGRGRACSTLVCSHGRDGRRANPLCFEAIPAMRRPAGELHEAGRSATESRTKRPAAMRATRAWKPWAGLGGSARAAGTRVRPGGCAVGVREISSIAVCTVMMGWECVVGYDGLSVALLAG